jgi:hypothetical protein
LAVDFHQYIFDGLEGLFRGQDLVEAVAGFDGAVADAQQGLVRVLEQVSLDGGLGVFAVGGSFMDGRHQRELGHLAAERGDDLLRRRRADAGQRGQPFGVLALDGVGDLADWANEGFHGLAGTDLVDGAEELEELQLRLGDEADQPWDHAALHGIAFEELAGVEGHLLAVLALDLAADEVGDQELILDGADLEPRFFIQHAIELAGHARDHSGVVPRL